MKDRLLSSKPIVVLVALLLALVIASSTAFASSSTGTSYSIAAATATPQFQCTEPCVVPTLIGYSYTGQGTCQTGCAGFPSDPVDATLTFSVTRTFPPNPCLMQRGTGTLDVTWPSDPSCPRLWGRSPSRPGTPRPWTSRAASPQAPSRCCSPTSRSRGL
jgi:hypothetical protein